MGHAIAFFAFFAALLPLSAFATPRSNCQFLLLENGNTISVRVLRPAEFANAGKIETSTWGWEKRAFFHAKAFTPMESITIPQSLLQNGYATTALGFQTALTRAANTLSGRYVLQLAIRLARAAGRTHGRTNEDQEYIAARVFVLLVNGRHAVLDAEAPGKETSKIQRLQEMQFSLLPSLQHLDSFAESSSGGLTLIKFLDGLSPLLIYLQGIQTRDVWEENTVALLDKLQFFAGYTATTLTSYSHQLSLYKNQKPSYYFSEWEATQDWDADPNPLLPLANQSLAFDQIETYFAQLTSHDGKRLGALLPLSKTESKKLTRELITFLTNIKPYDAVIRGIELLNHHIPRETSPIRPGTIRPPNPRN